MKLEKTKLYIKKINLQNYRNYEDSSFEFDTKGSLIIGQNGIGKTNLLEAIAYFTYGKSILNLSDAHLIKFQRESFFIKSDFMYDLETNSDNSGQKQSQKTFKVFYNTQKTKIIQIDDKPLKKLSDLYQHIQVVYSGPDDIFNIFSVPIKRRFFLDMTIAKVFPIYIDYLRRFKDTINQRNSLLKTEYNKTEKEAWDKTFCDDAKEVIEYRLRFFEIFKPSFSKAYKMIIENDEEVEISLKLNFFHREFVQNFMSLLKANSAKEKKYQTSLFGPHLDDFFITINQKNAIQLASQGQKRSIAVALKLAIANMITEINNIKPVLIFDDTLAELDKNRCENLFQNLAGKHQIFIASPTIERYIDYQLPILEL